jgi:hypothetical protein
MTLKTIEAAAMKLPADARSQLAAALLSTLDSDDSAETERMWVEEADRRYRDFRAGRTRAMSAKRAIAAARGAICAGSRRPSPRPSPGVPGEGVMRGPPR